MSSYTRLRGARQFVCYRSPVDDKQAGVEAMTQPDDRRVDTGDDEGAALDPFEIDSEANEADLIEQATAVPLEDDDGFDR